MALTKGDIVLVRFPFSDFSQTKLRPAVGGNAHQILFYFLQRRKDTKDFERDCIYHSI